MVCRFLVQITTIILFPQKKKKTHTKKPKQFIVEMTGYFQLQGARVCVSLKECEHVCM